MPSPCRCSRPKRIEVVRSNAIGKTQFPDGILGQVDHGRKFLVRLGAGRANVLTLSCKNRPPCGAHRGAVAAATERASEGAMCGRRAAEQFGAARGGSAAGPTGRRFLSACEGS